VALAPLFRADGLDELQRVTERVHLVPAEPGDQGVQHVDGGARVGKRPVARWLGTRKCRASEASRWLGTSSAIRVRRASWAVSRTSGFGHGYPELHAGGLEEAGVVRGVVRDPHRTLRKLEKTGQHLLDLRGGQQHGLGDAGQHGDERRQPLPRVTSVANSPSTSPRAP
jgi:hypothetical protein